MCVGSVRNSDRGDNYLHPQNSPYLPTFITEVNTDIPHLHEWQKHISWVNKMQKKCRNKDMWGVKSRINLCNLVAQSPLVLCNSTLNSQICKTKLKFSLHIRTTRILDLPGHQTNFKHFINIMWEPVRNPARGDDHLLSLNSLCLPILIMLNSKEYTAFHEWQIPLCSIRQAANKYRSPTFWYHTHHAQ